MLHTKPLGKQSASQVTWCIEGLHSIGSRRSFPNVRPEPLAHTAPACTALLQGAVEPCLQLRHLCLQGWDAFSLSRGAGLAQGPQRPIPTLHIRSRKNMVTFYLEHDATTVFGPQRQAASCCGPLLTTSPESRSNSVCMSPGYLEVHGYL